MIKVSVLYPNTENCRFDFDYYCKSHMALVKERLGAACQRIAVDKGIAGGGGSRPAYVASAHLFFQSLEAFQEAFAPHGEEFMADVPKYTNVEPVVLISEVLSDTHG